MICQENYSNALSFILKLNPFKTSKTVFIISPKVHKTLTDATPFPLENRKHNWHFKILNSLCATNCQLPLTQLFLKVLRTRLNLRRIGMKGSSSLGPFLSTIFEFLQLRRKSVEVSMSTAIAICKYSCW